MQQCKYETDCRTNPRRGDFDKDGDCSWCVLGIVKYCDRRRPSGICEHPALYLIWGDDFPGDRDDPDSVHTMHCSKCHEKAIHETRDGDDVKPAQPEKKDTADISESCIERMTVQTYRAECTVCGVAEYGESEYPGQSVSMQRFLKHLAYYGWCTLDGRLHCRDCANTVRQEKQRQCVPTTGT